jgi:hypothetical protein
MKPKAAVREQVSFHWAGWLKQVLAIPGMSNQAVGRALALALEKVAQDGAYAQLVADWATGDKVVSPRMAFQTGEVLNALGASFLSGPAALYGASYLADTIGICAMLVDEVSEEAAPAVVAILYASPHVFAGNASRELIEALHWSEPLSPEEIHAYIEAEKRRARFARELCTRMNDEHGECYVEAYEAWRTWTDRQGRPRPLRDRFAQAYDVAVDATRSVSDRRYAIRALLESWAYRHADAETRQLFGIRSDEERLAEVFLRFSGRSPLTQRGKP